MNSKSKENQKQTGHTVRIVSPNLSCESENSPPGQSQQLDKVVHPQKDDLESWRIYGADVDDSELKKAVANHLERKQKNFLKIPSNAARASIADPTGIPSRLTRRNSAGEVVDERSNMFNNSIHPSLKRRGSLWQPMREKLNIKSLVPHHHRSGGKQSKNNSSKDLSNSTENSGRESAPSTSLH